MNYLFYVQIIEVSSIIDIRDSNTEVSSIFEIQDSNEELFRYTIFEIQFSYSDCNCFHAIMLKTVPWHQENYRIYSFQYQN